jgi:hypothetical protein
VAGGGGDRPRGRRRRRRGNDDDVHDDNRIVVRRRPCVVGRAGRRWRRRPSFPRPCPRISLHDEDSRGGSRGGPSAATAPAGDPGPPPVNVAVVIATGDPTMRPPPGEGSSEEFLPVPRSGRRRCPTDPDDDPPGPGALSPPPSRPPLPPRGDPDGPASGAAATTPPDIGIDGSGGGGVRGCDGDCGGGSLIVRCMAGRGGGSEALWCCSRKTRKNKVNVLTQKAHKYCHQFERRVVRVVAIDLFKGAGSLHEILGHWWSRGAIGHCVAVFENFVPPDL